MDRPDTDKPFPATVQMHHKIIPYNITARLYSCNMSSVHGKKLDKLKSHNLKNDSVPKPNLIQPDKPYNRFRI